jgi:voltage-gated potassium channel
MDLNGKAPQIGDFPFTEECEAAVAALQGWKDRLLDYAVDNPLESLIALVTGGAWVLYLAEKEVNEGIETYDDALYYVSTCLSVGYANIFPRTQVGKFVAAVVMILGPSLTSWVIEGRLVKRQAPNTQPALPEPDPVVEKLEAILKELRAQRAEAA